jgi:hypothetical protein
MARVPVFFSFHFKNDVMRVHQVRNIGAIERNEPVSKNEWLQLETRGRKAIQNWIDDNMSRRRCVIVLIGSHTAGRPWINYEISKAWEDGRGLFGIHIHKLRCPNSGTCTKGRNPFLDVVDGNGRSLADRVRCYEPNARDAYNDIAANMEDWVQQAIKDRKRLGGSWGFW